MNVLEAEIKSRSAVIDRRRPDRPQHVSPELIPLMRGDAASVPDDPAYYGDPDQLAGARGLVLAAGLGAACWAAIVYIARWVM